MSILPFFQSMFTTIYSLEPHDIQSNMTNLATLHQDIKTIAKNLLRNFNTATMIKNAFATPSS